jgi:thymidine kinase
MNHPIPHKGHLEIICGPMFSGKSEELIRRLKRTKIAKKSTVVFKPSIDVRRGVNYVTSHDGSKIPAFPIDNAMMIPDLVADEIEVIGIDEAQFLSHELIDVVLELTEKGKYVIIAGLNLDFRAVPFGPMPTLMALADTVTKLSAICILCGDEAFFSQRLVNEKPAKYNDPLVKVGASESYQARCRDCYTIDKKAVWQNSL